MEKHTDGSWHMQETNTHVSDYIEIYGIGGAIPLARIDIHNEEDTANATLMASAPELLDALKAILAGLEDMTSEEFANGADKYLRDLATTAILKATGKE